MALFPQKKKTCTVVFVDQHIVMIRGERYVHHDHELQEIKKMLKLILKKVEPPNEDAEKQKLFDTLSRIKKDIENTVI